MVENCDILRRKKIISYQPPGKVEGKKLIREDVSGAAKDQSAAEVRWKFAIGSEEKTSSRQISFLMVLTLSSPF